MLAEPSTGLDPRSRAGVWEAVRELAAAGTTVLLTPQYLEEADRLCSRISVLDRGRIVAEGSPAELKARVGGSRAEIAVPEGRDPAAVARRVSAALGAVAELDPATRRISIPMPGGTAGLHLLARGLDEAGLGAGDVTLRRPDLDEVFLHLTADRPAERVAS